MKGTKLEKLDLIRIFFGKTVTLSKDGNTLAVFADALNDDGTSRAFVEVYKRKGIISLVNITNDWEKKYVIRTVDTNETTGQGALDASNLSLSNDGSMLAVGYPTDSDNTTTPGFVNVYKLNDTSWEEVATIEGINDSDFFGYSVALSDSGSLLAVGAKQSTSDTGYAAIYNENTDGTWTQVNTSFDVTEDGDATGSSVAMSADGTLMAVGSPGGDKADVFDISTNSITVDDNIDDLGDYTKHKVAFRFNGAALGFDVSDINLTNAEMVSDGLTTEVTSNGLVYTVIIAPTPDSIIAKEPFITITLADGFREDNPQVTETSFSYVYMPDANFRAALATHSNIIDTNKDNIISYEEVASYATYGLNCSGKGITDLTGIGAFSSISGEVRFNANQLTSVDLSNNLKINYLELSDNELTSIDVSMLPDLNKFYIDQNNLETLDVTNNPKMLYLEVRNNPLTSIDINNPILQGLWVKESKLKSLDLSHTNIESLTLIDNPLLENFNLAVYKNSNDINYVNISNNPMLTCMQVIFDSSNDEGLNIGFYDVNSGSLDALGIITEYDPQEGACLVEFADDNFENALVNTSIDTDTTDGGISYVEAAAFTGTISVANKSIADMTGIEAFVNITGLDCSNNDIENLDVSYNTALTSLNCFTNSLVELDLSQNIALTYINCAVNNLTSLNVANGYNKNIANEFYALQNSGLTCIQVDDADYSTTNWTFIDDTASFSIDGNCESLSVNTELITDDAIRVSPNPVTNILNVITTSGVELKHAKLYSIVGKELVSTTSSQLDASSLPTGMYILKVESTDGKIQTKKIIKR
ncbi:MAG: T9SS type A sorting domain-containing protein [Algibacter sp.]